MTYPIEWPPLSTNISKIEVEKVSGNNQLLTSFFGCIFKRSFCDDGSFDEKKEQVYYVAIYFTI